MDPCNTKKTPTLVIPSGIICVALAISLATLAWINGLPTPDVRTEELILTNHQWGPNYKYIDVTLHNNGTQIIKLNSITINLQPTTVVYIAGSNQINTGETLILRIANAFTPKETYQLIFQTNKGNKFVYTNTAQSTSN